MGLSFGEIFVVFLVGMLFFKPQEIKEYLRNIFVFKKNVENDLQNLTNQVQNKTNTTEFFEIKTPCQKQQ